jgi:hypothetical protein
VSMGVERSSGMVSGWRNVRLVPGISVSKRAIMRPSEGVKDSLRWMGLCLGIILRSEGV